MATALTPHIDTGQIDKPEREAMPVVNPITVSMALAMVFLFALLAVMAAQPMSAHERQGADDGRPPVASLERPVAVIAD